MNIAPVRLTVPVMQIVAWAVGACLVISLGFGAWQSFRLAQVRTMLADERRARSEDQGEAAAAARIQAEDFRRREDQWSRELRKVSDDADKDVERARADAAAAAAAGDRLQQRVAELIAAARRAPEGSAAADPGPTAEDAARMLADMLRRTDEAAGLFARIADERGAAGLACERAHDTVTSDPE